MNICVFGSASEDIGEQYKKDTEAICKALAECGDNLVFGGGGTGLMGAAARGFAAGGGNIYGFIPTFIVDKDVEPPFGKCTSLVETKTMHERKRNMEELADAYLIVPGGIGTMEEFFEILVARSLGQESKPIVMYNADGYFDDILAFIQKAVSNVEIHGLVHVKTTPEEVIQTFN